MRRCPQCSKTYDESWGICLIDGAVLSDTADVKKVGQVPDKNVISKEANDQTEAPSKSNFNWPPIISTMALIVVVAFAFIGFNYLFRLTVYICIVGVPSGIVGVVISEIYGKMTGVSDDDKHVVFILATSLLALAILIYLFSQGLIDFSFNSVLVTELY